MLQDAIILRLPQPPTDAAQPASFQTVPAPLPLPGECGGTSLLKAVQRLRISGGIAMEADNVQRRMTHRLIRVFQ